MSSAIFYEPLYPYGTYVDKNQPLEEVKRNIAKLEALKRQLESEQSNSQSR